MALITGVITFTTAHPSAGRVRHNLTTTYNSSEPGTITLTVPNDYRRLRIVHMIVGGVVAATLPAFADGEKALFRLDRSGAIHGAIHSKPTTLWSTAGVVLDRIEWEFSSDDLRYVPVIFPRDTLVIRFPTIDDDASPLGDVITQADFQVEKR